MAKVAADYSAGLVRHIGSVLKEARSGRSAAWLSGQTAELGYRISPSVIAKLDSGHRGSVLSIAEVLVLSAALNVPILDLLADAEVLPEVKETRSEVLGRLTGTPDVLSRRTITDKLTAAKVEVDSVIELLNGEKDRAMSPLNCTLEFL